MDFQYQNITKLILQQKLRLVKIMKNPKIYHINPKTIVGCSQVLEVMLETTLGH